MLCDATHRILHRARSLRRLRPSTSDDSNPPPTYHKRQVSTSSSVSSTDSTSFRREVEYDPLRLHPSMEIERGPHVPPQTFYEHEADEVEKLVSFYHRHSRDASREEPVRPQPIDLLPRRPRSSEHEIHGGFDFGFHQPSSSPSAASFTSTASSSSLESVSARPLRAAGSVVDLRRRDAAWAEAVDAPPMPVSPRRRLPPVGGHDFIKRGGWKRRGIVFSGGDERVMDEDDAFEIP